jgi:hypothetical protein
MWKNGSAYDKKCYHEPGKWFIYMVIKNILFTHVRILSETLTDVKSKVKKNYKKSENEI